MAAPPASVRLPGLDLLRALAIGWIMRQELAPLAGQAAYVPAFVT